MGYSSRIMAESWESNTLYWAALADELHVSPAQLNVLIPEWTQQAGGADLRLAPGRLAGAAALAAPGGRRCARQKRAQQAAEQKAALQ